MAHLTASFWNRRVSEYRSRNTAMFVGSCADAIIDGRQRSRGQAGVPANPADTTAVECSKLDWLEARRRSKMDRLSGVHSERWNCASKRRLTTSLCLYDQRVKNNRRPARHTGGGRQVTFRSVNHQEPQYLERNAAALRHDRGLDLDPDRVVSRVRDELPSTTPVPKLDSMIVGCGAAGSCSCCWFEPASIAGAETHHVSESAAHDALRTRMFGDRSTVRSRGIGRPTRGRCGRDPEGHGDSSRPRCPPLRHCSCNRSR